MKLDEMIIRTLETQVANLDSVLSEVKPQGRQKKEIKVASIYFGFKNGELIRTLKQRGANIGSGAFEKVQPQDDLLNQIIKEDIDKLKQPVCAFVTFTEQEAYERCEEYFFKYLRTDKSYNTKYQPLQFLEEETLIEAAPEPSNIVWENLECTAVQRASRKFCVIVTICVFIFLTFLLYSSLK